MWSRAMRLYVMWNSPVKTRAESLATTPVLVGVLPSQYLFCEMSGPQRSG